MQVLVLNGPNLKRLDLREKSVYGDFDYKALESFVASAATDLGIESEIRQTDNEAELIGWLHEAADKKLPLIINPAAFT
ncbi:MAG: type II 3-dehydroquinate dehydratase, partial [Actinomycetota bacterium]